MNRVLCSTGALLAEYAPQLNFDGFEFMVYDSWYDNLGKVVRYVVQLGLNIPTLHCEKAIGTA